MAHRIMQGENLGRLRMQLEARVAEDPSDAPVLLDLGILLELSFYKNEGLACQARAITLGQVFRIPAPASSYCQGGAEMAQVIRVEPKYQCMPAGSPHQPRGNPHALRSPG